MIVLAVAFAICGCTTLHESSPASGGVASGALSAKPYYRPAGTGPALWGPGDRYTFLVTGEESDNTLFQFEAVVPKGSGPPPHIHHREDESFYLVKGTLEVLVGDKVITAKAGDFVFGPRGAAHSFKNVGEDTAVMLVTAVPAGLERYFREVFTPVTDRDAAPPPMTDELLQKLNEFAPEYGLEFLPPQQSDKP